MTAAKFTAIAGPLRSISECCAIVCRSDGPLPIMIRGLCRVDVSIDLPLRLLVMSFRMLFIEVAHNDVASEIALPVAMRQI